jgi:D-aspartate ligase
MGQLNNHLFIVISGDTGNALGVIRSLGEAGIKPVLIYLVEETHLPLLIKSKYLDVVHKVYSYEDGVDLLLEKYKGNDLKPFVYTCDDSVESVIDSRYDDLKDSFFFFNAGELGRINYLMNKKVICDIAESCGYRAPKNEVVKRGEMPKTLSYPIITKTLMSIMGAWKADSFICRNEEELRSAYEMIQAEELILEEYIDKKNELALEGFSVNGGNEVFIPYGISFFRFRPGAYGHYMWCRSMGDDENMEGFREIIRKCRYEGCFEIEFLIDKNDNLWFLEVNFRYSFWNYAVTYGGLNYPMMWAESMLAGTIVPPDESSYSKLPVKTYFTALCEPGDYVQCVVKEKIPFGKWLMDVRKADMLYFYNPKDKLPAWSFWTHKILRKVLGWRSQ